MDCLKTSSPSATWRYLLNTMLGAAASHSGASDRQNGTDAIPRRLAAVDIQEAKPQAISKKTDANDTCYVTSYATLYCKSRIALLSRIAHEVMVDSCSPRSSIEVLRSFVTPQDTLAGTSAQRRKS
jgi:hypothetical protein